MVLPIPPMGPGGPGGPPTEPGLALFQLLPPELLQTLAGIPVEGQVRREEPEAPDEQTLKQRIDDVKALWSERDVRMDEDEDLYHMVEADEHPEAVIRNIPYVTVEKVANMLGAQTPIISLIAPDQRFQDTAQRVEDMLRHYRMEWDREWQASGHTSLEHSIFHYLSLRGWLTIRTTYDPHASPQEPVVRLDVIDPRNVYPMPGTRGYRYVAHIQHVTVSEALDEWPEARELLAGKQLDDRVELKAYYDREYHAVFIDDSAVKPPTPHHMGFLPWTIRISGGTPSRGTNRTGGSTDWTRNVGPSIFHGARHAIKRLNVLFSQLSDVVAMASNPPKIFKYDQMRGDPEPIEVGPGATNYIFPTESVEVIRNAPQPSDVAPLLNGLTEDVFMGTIPKILWGGVDGDQSGFAIALSTGAARDALYGVITAAQSAWEDIYAKTLTIVRDIHQRPVGIVTRDQNGNWVGGAMISPEEISNVGTKVKVEYRDVSPQDMMQMAQLAVMLTERNLISMETAREEYLRIENSAKEHAKIVSEMPYQDPELMKGFMVPYMLAKTDPEGFQLWLALQRHKEMQMQAMPPPAPPGVLPLGGAPGMLPPQMGPNPMDFLQQAMGAAAGGADMRREEGVSGFGGLIPGGLGVR